MGRFLQRLFDIREGEGLKASLMFTYIFLVIASVLILKPVRDSLFLNKVGAEKLPLVFLLVAVFAAAVNFFQFRFKGKAQLNRQISTSTTVSIACLIIFWLLLHFGFQGGVDSVYILYLGVDFRGCDQHAFLVVGQLRLQREGG